MVDWTEKEEKLMVEFDNEVKNEEFKKHSFSTNIDAIEWINKL